MIKMIVSDMDGTLLGRNGITDKTIQSVLNATKAGLEFVVATGRDLSSVKPIFEPHHIPFSAILGNGAQYCDVNGEIIMSSYLKNQYVKPILKIFEDLDIHYMIFTDNGFYSTKPQVEVAEAFIQRSMHQFKKTREELLTSWANSPIHCMQLIQIDSLTSFLEQNHHIIKIEAFDIDLDKIAKAKQELAHIKGIAFLSSYPDNVEVTDANAQKGLILKKVIELKGIKKEEVAVFGDGLNDSTLFELFTESFAVDNAVPEIKAMAKYHIPSHKDDGVALTIDQIIAKQQR